MNGGLASAQSNTGSKVGVNAGNGMRVSPVRYDVTVKPGTTQTIDLTVEDLTGQAAELQGVVNDFLPSTDENGQPRVLFDETDENAPSHGVRKFVTPIKNFKLAPKERKIIKVVISVPKNAAGGGYYGAVRFLPSTADSGKNVNLTASVGSLLLVTVPGDLKEQLSIASINVSRGANGKASSLYTSGRGLKTSIRFKNSGNVQVEPFGKLLLRKGNTEITNIDVNSKQPRSSVLPDSTRRYEINLDDKAQAFGKYTVVGSFAYGSKNQLITASTTFYVVPLLYIIVGIALLVLIVLLGFIIPRMLKAHDRRLIRRLRGGKM